MGLGGWLHRINFLALLQSTILKVNWKLLNIEKCLIQYLVKQIYELQIINSIKGYTSLTKLNQT